MVGEVISHLAVLVVFGTKPVRPVLDCWLP